MPSDSCRKSTRCARLSISGKAGPMAAVQGGAAPWAQMKPNLAGPRTGVPPLHRHQCAEAGWRTVAALFTSRHDRVHGWLLQPCAVPPPTSPWFLEVAPDPSSLCDTRCSRSALAR